MCQGTFYVPINMGNIFLAVYGRGAEFDNLGYNIEEEKRMRKMI